MLSLFEHRIPKAVLCFLCILLMLLISIALPLLQARAVLVVDDIAIAAIMALLAAWGIDLIATVGISNTNISSSMQGLLSAAGVAADLTADAITVPATGIMGIPKAIYNAARSLANYIKTNYFAGTDQGSHTIYSNGIVGIPASITITDSYPFTYSSTPAATSHTFAISTGSGYLIVSINAGSPNNFLRTYTSGVSDYLGMSSNVTIDGVTYRYATASCSGVPSSAYVLPSSVYVVNDMTATMNNVKAYFEGGDIASLAVSAEDAAIPSSDTDEDKYVAVPGSGFTTLTGAKDYWYDRTKDDAADRTAPVEADSEQDAEDAMEDAPYVPSVSPVSGLAAVFPFCIPFDIYNFLSVFQATRQAPSVTLPIAFPAAIGGTRNITIDLSGFDSVATVLRTCELIAFCIGLAAATWKYIKW